MHTKSLKYSGPACFFSPVVLSVSQFFPSLPPSLLASDFRQGPVWNNRPVSVQTKPGSVSIHFQGATAAVREHVRVEKGVLEGARGCVRAHYIGRSVDGAKSDMIVEKQN